MTSSHNRIRCCDINTLVDAQRTALCYDLHVLKPLKHVQDLLAENAELLARLKLADDQNRRPQRENERLQGLKPENVRLGERVVLLEEEVRWFKEQFFGRSSQKSTSEMSAEQKLLFNEAEGLSAIEAADAAQAARTTAISAHERKAHTGGPEVVPAHLPSVWLKLSGHNEPPLQACYIARCISESVKCYRA